MFNIFNIIKVNFCNSNVIPSQTQSKLEVNRQIAEAFISHLSKFRRQLSAFSDANYIAFLLQQIEIIANNVIDFIQDVQGGPKVT